MAVAHHVAQAREVALRGPTAASSSAGRATCRIAAERLVALRAGELLFHLRQRRSDDVVMVHVRADRLDGVEPEAMDQIEIAGRERRRMRAEVIGVGRGRCGGG